MLSIMGNWFDILKAFGMPLCQYDSFYILFGRRKKMPFSDLCVSPVLMQNQDICNFMIH